LVKFDEKVHKTFTFLKFWVGGEMMFNITDYAYIALKEIVDKEQNENEKLYIRVSMGIG
jgi:hypothetical protein